MSDRPNEAALATDAQGLPVWGLGRLSITATQTFGFAYGLGWRRVAARGV